MSTTHICSFLVVSKCALLGIKEAITTGKEAIRIDPNHFKAHFNSGVVYFNLKKNDEAIESFKKAVEIKPDFADTYYSLGVTYNQLGQYEKATVSYEETIRISEKVSPKV